MADDSRAIRRHSPEHLATVSIATVLSMLAVIFVVQDLTRQPVLVTSLASSMFLLYFQPRNEINAFRPLVLGHLLAAAVGFAATHLFPTPYLSSALSLSVSVFLLASLRLIHPPAISTSLVFAYRPRDMTTLATFLLTLVVVVTLALLYLALRHGLHNTRWAAYFDPDE